MGHRCAPPPLIGATFRSSGGDTHEFEHVPVLGVELHHEPDTQGVEFALLVTGIHGREVVRLKAIREEPECDIGDDPRPTAESSIVERSDSLLDRDLVLPDPVPTSLTYWTAELPDGRMGRYAFNIYDVHNVYPEEGPDRPTPARIRILIASGREDLVALEHQVILGCTIVSLLLVGMIGTLSWFAVARGMEPTKRLAAAIDAIHVDNLPDGLDVGELPVELAPFADKADALIRRIDAALQRERRTTADIAHELRTPLSELLTVSEVALRAPRDDVAARRALATVRDVAWRMGRAVSTLLKLARLDMGTERFDCTDVDLGLLVGESFTSLAALERERGLQVNNGLKAGDVVDGDRSVLRIVVSNLVSNALYYARQEGRVTARLEREGRIWRLIIENDAADISAKDLEALSEPFWRKDAARTDRDRSGLWLALSRSLAGKSGMELSFEFENHLFRATLAGKGSQSGGEGRSAASATGDKVA